MTRIIAITLLFSSFWGCNLIFSPGNCPDIDPYFDINGFMFSNKETFFEDLPDNSPANFNEHRFYVNYTYTLYAHSPSKGGFFSQAYALSCVEPIYEGSMELIEYMIVTTNYDINDTYQAGDTITNLMMFNDFQFETPLSDYLAQDDKSILTEWFWLNLIERPTATDTVSVNLTIKLNNGESYTETSERVIFR